MDIPFCKYHALGNDYIVLDPNKISSPLKLKPEQIKLICHRNLGIGSDGILLGPTAELSSLLPFSVKIFNPDGSEAEKSGNGIRIFARYLRDKGYVKESSFVLTTKGGEVLVEFLGGKSDLIRVDMGRSTFQSQKIPVCGKNREVVNESLIIGKQKFKVTCVSVGNPHCVIPLKTISPELAKKIGPLVENHKIFPRRINMQLVKIIDKKNIQIEIWERGAGYTLASGSSSCAAVTAAHRLGLVGKSVSVQMPGGKLKIDLRDDGHVLMTGPVTRVASGALDILS